MPDLFAMLAEAHICDWQRRQAAGETTPGPAGPLVDSWENQLFQEILTLREQARATGDAGEAAALRRRAEQLRLQLIVPLERDQPGWARALDAELSKRR